MVARSPPLPFKPDAATPKTERSARFEASDVPAWLPLWLGMGLAGFVIGVLVAIAIFFPLASHQQYRGPLQPLPPAPQLQVAPGSDLTAYRSAKDRELEGHGGSGSIEAAMRATARQGWGPPR